MLRFRNLDVTPDDPVARWGVEGLLTAIERGGVRDWARIRTAIIAAPYGPVATELEEAIELADSPSGVAAMRRMLATARETPRDRAVRHLRELAGLADASQQTIAAAIGTSRSRLSTYLSGSVMPSAEVVAALEQYAQRRRAELL